MTSFHINLNLRLIALGVLIVYDDVKDHLYFRTNDSRGDVMGHYDIRRTQKARTGFGGDAVAVVEDSYRVVASHNSKIEIT
ncbi:MAG: hypothetical protein C4K49_04475 [Candidatus Thorarchaeota archaeon]|nr:MAG: hypothetical protein C4K49_04475 [Candidatus Thorarchaeota archaeon]